MSDTDSFEPLVKLKKSLLNQVSDTGSSLLNQVSDAGSCQPLVGCLILYNYRTVLDYKILMLLFIIILLGIPKVNLYLFYHYFYDLDYLLIITLINGR